MDRAQRERMARAILERSPAEQTEVLIGQSDDTLTRFTHQISNQNVAALGAQITVRAILAGRTGVASTNSVDEDALRALVERAVAMARLAPKDPLQPPLPVGKPAPAPPNAYVEATARASPERRAQLCKAVFSAAERADCWCAGYASTASSAYTIANSNGALASFEGTDAAVNVKMIGTDSSGWAEEHTTDVARIDAAAVAARAVGKRLRGAAPRSVEPGPWCVILEPAAFGELLAYLAGHFSAQSYDEGSSFCSEGLERRYFGENVSMFDDYAHPLAPGMPFDFEGFPTQRLPLVEHGVVRNVVTDSYYAHKLDRENTGHALPAPNSYGPQPLHLVVAPGTARLEELIAGTARGLLVTRFWYIRTVDQKQAIVTGMTRDGTFLVEHGRVVGGVRNLRFNQSILEALRACEFSSEQVRTAGYGFSTVVPAAKIDGFTFTSATEF
ncbi:MAG TPA: TldD/PmbA family protein [Candidatus Tyrphobacter sp.]